MNTEQSEECEQDIRPIKGTPKNTSRRRCAIGFLWRNQNKKYHVRGTYTYIKLFAPSWGLSALQPKLVLRTAPNHIARAIRFDSYREIKRKSTTLWYLICVNYSTPSWGLSALQPKLVLRTAPNHIARAIRFNSYREIKRKSTISWYFFFWLPQLDSNQRPCG